MIKTKTFIVTFVIQMSLLILYFKPLQGIVNSHAEADSGRKDNLKKHEHSNKHGNKDHDEHGEERVVPMNEAGMKEFGIETDTAGPGKLYTYLTLPGEISVNPDRLAHIVPRVSGMVRDVKKTLGDYVKKGEVMAVIESAELGRAKIEYLTLKQRLQLALIDLERIKVIHDNTASMLDRLHDSPDMEKLQNDIAGLDMGSNRSSLISSYANLILTRETYKREKSLYEKRISSHADFLKAERDYKSAYAEYLAINDEISFAIKRQLFDAKRAVSAARSALHAAESNLHILGLTEKDMDVLRDKAKHDISLARIEIRAPFSGAVIEKHITLGEMLKSDSKAFVIADLSSVWANLNVYRKDLPFISKGQRVIISSGHGIPDVNGIISWISPIVGEETRTAVARVTLPNKDGRLMPGLFVNGRVAVGEDATVPIIIPKAAIHNIDGKDSVFIKTEEGFEPQPVIKGRDSGDKVEILSGLNHGQVYVIRGAFTLKAQLAKGSFGDGHNH